MLKVFDVLQYIRCAAPSYNFYRKDRGLTKDVLKLLIKRTRMICDGIDFYPTRCAFSIPSPRIGNRKRTTRWIKNHTIANHEGTDICYYAVNYY